MSLGFSWAISLTRGRRDLSNILIIIIPKLIMKELYYIGLDVHKDTVAIASIKSTSRAEATYHSTCGGSNAAVESALRKVVYLSVSFVSLFSIVCALLKLLPQLRFIPTIPTAASTIVRHHNQASYCHYSCAPHSDTLPANSPPHLSQILSRQSLHHPQSN
jgi:hypothetical protein